MIKDSNDSLLTLAGLGLAAVILTQGAKAQPDTAPALLLSGHYLDNGNIYSPEIDTVNNRMYFSGWYDYIDYPYDAIYVTDLNNITNVRKLLRFSPYQIGDPSIVDNNMFMTYSPDPLDVTKQKIAMSTTSNNGVTWSDPSYIIDQAWLPSAIQTDKLYVYYTRASLDSVQLRRAELNSSNAVVATIDIVFDETDFYPINVDIKYYDGVYYLLGDYWALVDNIATYCIGMWTSISGVFFTKYSNNPVVIPSSGNIIARTPYFIKEGNKLRIWYAQQKPNWWTNVIYYVEHILH